MGRVNRDLRSMVAFRIGESEEGFELYQKLSRYKNLKGWTWRQFVLRAFAECVYEDNPVLSQEIAEFLIVAKKSRS